MIVPPCKASREKPVVEGKSEEGDEESGEWQREGKTKECWDQEGEKCCRGLHVWSKEEED